MIVLAALLLVVYAIVSSAVTGSGVACGGSGEGACVAPVLQYVFLVPGIALLAVGALLLVLVFRDLS